ncbi:DUF1236 domain-containing protein [Bradyrhizobium quebecense]|uniref:DUF1236 domain-containing protein n=2 Tax=Bradyrhizobium quebecense TaxID=2748629 RepID=A0A939RS12_9BRAD|nr:DUF1236 domain-containing protein [Bradyrhizobium quebecense]UGA46547.1 DUF1236 domain-containing protein [Bradyrhizobium quebecense]UGY02813.1 DUF1236 domain-containing protein [Bradyrhizobium quebecense]
MTNRFLISVAAAALIAGTGFANAQGAGGANKETGAGGGATVQHSAPSGGASSGTMQRDTGGMKGSEHSTTGQSSSGMKDDASGMKGAESEKSGPATKGAQENTQKSKGMSSENDATKGAKEGSKDMKAEGRDKSGNMRAEEHDKSGKMNNAAESREKNGATTNQNAQTKSPTDTNRAQTNDTSRTQTTTGNAATSATAAPPAEKRTQISTAIRSEHVTETTNVNFNVAVGTRVPADVHFYPVPERVVTIYPQWRGYEFILVHGRYIIVQPETHEIVYIIEG